MPARWLLPLLSLCLAACAAMVNATYSPPTVLQKRESYERIVNKDFERTWQALVEYTSSAFFAIDKFERASGLMTLSFGASEPERFVDCGRMVTDVPGQGVKDESYAAFLTRLYKGKLDGKMNIFVKPLDDRSTLVRVSARYILSSYDSRTGSVTWTFDSGKSATVSVPVALPGTSPARTCRPSYVAETAVLDAVGR